MPFKILYLVLLSIYCIGNVNCGVYYIADSLVNQDNCSVNGTGLSPCYTLQQLIQDEILPSSSHMSNTSVELVLLPGAHVIPEHRTFSVSNYSKLSIHSLYEKQGEVMIKCESNVSLLFQDITNMKMSSLHFTYCAIQWFYSNNNSYCRVKITSSSFEKTKQEYALVVITSIITNTPDMEFNISDCLFSANNGAIRLGSRYILSLKGVKITIINSIFMGNRRYSGDGGALYAQNAELQILDSQFINNSARSGGAIFLLYQCSTKLKNTIFNNNTASKQGGSIYLIGLLDETSGCTKNNDFSAENCQFNKNSAKLGGAIACDRVSGAISLLVGIFSTLNSAIHGDGGFAYLSICRMIIEQSSISSNDAENGGVLYVADESEITLNSVYFTNNTARDGGAVYLRNSVMNLFSGSGWYHNRIRFYSNTATNNGGGIYVQEQYCQTTTYYLPKPCFFYADSDSKMIFRNNSARQGPVLYGGLLDRCISNYDNSLGINVIYHLIDNQLNPRAITSDPAKVCFCDENHIICNKRHLTLQAMRGQTISMFMVTVDQDRNPKQSAIRAEYAEPDAELSKGEVRQQTSTICEQVHYHIFTQVSSSVNLILQPDDFRDRSNLSSVTVTITIVSCTRGLEQDDDRCVCERRLRKYFHKEDCNVGDDTIQTRQSLWLRYDTQHLKVHTNCPLDYCQLSDTISLSHPDQQCSNNHSGVICGGCQDNHSIALGSSKCLKCASSYAFAWLIPVFAVAGLALVALLWVCNMTTAHGTLNGLIFYANVVSINGLTSLNNCSIHPILSVFIAWVNLDFGVETCFYSGMNTYQKTWLQFAFPFYIWLLVGAIIVSSHYSSRAMKVFGSSNVAILATLFLLSYTKILKTIVTALDFTQVLQGSTDNVSDPLVPYSVWTHDGNFHYLKGKHVPLFAVALMILVFLFLPYTLLLTFGQCVRSLPARKLRCVVWCIRSTAFISIMDAYHAPCNRKHRYWTGLLLLTRCVLFLTVTIIYKGSLLQSSMYITTLVLIGILTLKATCAHKVYRSYLVNILELCFLLNLVILSATLYYLQNNSGTDDDTICKCTSASISVSMVMFLGILTYHTYLRVSKKQWFVSFKYSLLAKWRSRHRPTDITEENAPTILAPKQPTTSTVELRESLLDSEVK